MVITCYTTQHGAKILYVIKWSNTPHVMLPYDAKLKRCLLMDICCCTLCSIYDEMFEGNSRSMTKTAFEEREGWNGLLPHFLMRYFIVFLLNRGKER